MDAQATPRLNRDDMDRIAEAHGCTINTKKKTRRTHVYLRDQGTLVYLGYQSILESLNEAEFTARLAARLAKSVEGSDEP